MARRKHRLARTASLFQVWVCSAKGDGHYWLAFASRDWKKAAAEYKATREDYVKAEFRDPTGHVLASHDVGRCDPKERDFALEYWEINADEFVLLSTPK